MSMYQTENYKRKNGPGEYNTEKFANLASMKRSPVYSLNKTDKGSIFGNVNPYEKKPDLGTYTPKYYKKPSHMISTPTNHNEISKNFFSQRNLLKASVGPQTYNVIPNI